MGERFSWYDLRYRWFCVRYWLQQLPDRLAWKIAYWLPREVALKAFIRVYSTLDSPGSDYVAAYANWEAGIGR